MNGFAILCVSLGFLSLVSIYLPSQISEARAKKEGSPGVMGMIQPVDTASPEKVLQRESKQVAQLPPWLVTPKELENDVAFWRNIYATYNSHQTVFHDNQYLDIVYHVEDFSSLENDPNVSAISKEKKREDTEEAIKEVISAHLDEIAQLKKPTSLSPEEQKIWQRFSALPNGFQEAKERVRAQGGLRDKFAEGMKSSVPYLSKIEQIFLAQGLPKELTRLIFVESLFNLHAESSVGARGIWQFMRSSGKHYQLKINKQVDERTDPIKASLAAAQLLKDNYNYLGSWPLAINAYNAGRGRLKQASQQLGTTDIARIVREYRHPSYGFASRNFYLEFLAAYDVVENHELYFE